MERAIIEGAAGGFRSIALNADDTVSVIDQTLLPFELKIAVLRTSEDCLRAIKDMVVRGAPLIGAAAAFGLFLAAKEAPAELWDAYLRKRAAALAATRPTAVNLERALSRVLAAALEADSRPLAEALSRSEALRVAEEDADRCRMIGLHGLELIRKVFEREGRRVNILTHCNAGALACVEFGTATAPIYAAQDAGIPIHVWVDETRPRNQGASLTAWELGRRGVAHTLICDNAGGHLMQRGMVDLVLTGADRVAASGDVANKIGTYLKALAARDNGLPFYAAFPSTSFDWGISDGIAEIPIEERSPDEVRYVEGLHDGERTRVLICPEATGAANYGFDVTPARLIDGLITERGICAANAASIAALFPEASA